MQTAISERNEPTSEPPTILVHLASGIGNIILATPLLMALNQMEFIVELLLHADYPQTADLLRDWSVIRKIYDKHFKNISPFNSYDFVIPAIPPFYWPRFARFYKNTPKTICRPPDALFYQNEQEYYLAFARALGYPADQKPFYCLPIAPSENFGVTGRTLIIAPGCKTGEMAAKRWPYYPQLAERFEDIAIVGTADDLHGNDGKPVQFPQHARLFIDTLTLRETAELLAAAGAVVGNDSGLSHIAVAVGTPTVMLFGPTPHLSLGQLPPNAKVLRTGLACEPCWFTQRFRACSRQIDCLRQITVETVEHEIQILLGLSK
jgi:ADP-heptose:LPS heptosyltransferase